MAHAPADEAPLPDGYSVSDEFFVYKFSKEQAGLSGLAFDEGIFSVFGYVTQVSTSCCRPPHVLRWEADAHQLRGMDRCIAMALMVQWSAMDMHCRV